MSEIKLLPCPFCGGEAEYCKGDWIGKEYWVKCTKCSCKTSLSNNYKKPIEEWNTRKPMERIIERLNGKRKNLCGRYNHETPLLEMPSCKIAFNNGICEAIEVVKEEGGIE